MIEFLVILNNFHIDDMGKLNKNIYCWIIYGLFLESITVVKTEIADKRNSRFILWDNETFTCDYFCYTSNGSINYVPPKFSDPCTPETVSSHYIARPGEFGIEVDWTEPQATDRNEDTPRIEQVLGDKNGSYFNASAEGRRYDIVYLAIDKDGLKASCHFDFEVYDKLICPAPPVIENGLYTCTDSSNPGSTCTYYCNEGNRMKGYADVYCQPSQQTFPVWSPVPTCEVIHCLAPPNPKNGYIVCDHRSYVYHSLCTVTCESGYNTVGPIYMTCQADGSWSKPTSCVYPEPLAVHCISPQIFYTKPNTTSSAVTWEQPTSAAVVNNMIEMYQTEGPSQGDTLHTGLHTVTYEMFYNGSNETAECRIELHIKVVTCEHPALISNDSFLLYDCSSSTGIQGTSCSVSCQRNFQLVGASSMTCVDNGQKQGVWDLEPDGQPFCNDTVSECPKNLKNPAHGKLLYIDNGTSPEVLVVCEDGYDLQYNFSGNVSCLDGEWEYDKIPDCNAEMRPDYILKAEVYFFGQGCPENASAFYQEYSETFQNEFEAKCPENVTCKVNNMSIGCVPISTPRLKRELPEINSSNVNLVQAAFHALSKRRATHRFVVSLTISVEAGANGTQDFLNNHKSLLRQIWEENQKWVVSHVLGMLQVKLDFQVDYWDFVNYTKAVCTDNYILSGSRCRTCSVGNYFNHTSNECQYCPVGEYKDENGLSTCTTCPKETSTKSTGSDSIYACKGVLLGHRSRTN